MRPPTSRTTESGPANGVPSTSMTASIAARSDHGGGCGRPYEAPDPEGGVATAVAEWRAVLIRDAPKRPLRTAIGVEQVEEGEERAQHHDRDGSRDVAGELSELALDEPGDHRRDLVDRRCDLRRERKPPEPERIASRPRWSSSRSAAMYGTNAMAMRTRAATKIAPTTAQAPSAARTRDQPRARSEMTSGAAAAAMTADSTSEAVSAMRTSEIHASTTASPPMTRRRQPKASRLVSHGGTSLGVLSDEAGESLCVTGRQVCLRLNGFYRSRPQRRSSPSDRRVAA